MSSDRPHLNWKVPTAEWDAFVTWVRAENGDTKGEVGRAVESAIQEWINADDYHEVEQRIDRLVRAAGRTPENIDEKNKPISEGTLGDGEDVDLTQVGARVDRELKEAFKAFVKKHTDDRLGIALARALREYRHGGRPQRLEDKLDRIIDDAEGLLSEISDTDSTLSTKEKRTVAMCRQIHDLPLTVGVQPIPRRDIHVAIESVMGSLSDYLKETYTPLILERLEYEPSPSNADLFFPIGDAEQQRREETETEATQQMDVLTQSIPATDGGTSN
ncbi:hypothetical protein [Halalkalicoccus sp. NIPERK01]|uniref:hypothetical protein n=1 Tax=Halalkalicoccus sp. NIPERK01 TaxID=3053469 RepID=UPI00256F2826|nr:hypothetical protein [Halalkalicoccus sp. NIPERK01]MDL5363909.1 hypothetical protein [Halalkalicoccus sp. NIPERK01]